MIFLRQPRPMFQHSPFHYHHDPRVLVIHSSRTGCGPNNEDATKSTTATDSSNKITDGSASASVVYHSRGVHVTESKESTKLSIDLPGVKANDVQVVLENGKLRVKAERKAGKQVTFHRELPIDDSVIESSMASLVDGVLTISLTKKQSPESVSVAVASEYPPESITEENVHFSLDLPGVKSSDLKVTRLSGNIAIEGERKNGQFSSTVKRSYEVDTKTVDVDSIRAFLADGVLTFVAPRKEGPPALTIPVSTLIENSTSEPPKKQAKLDIESSETAPKQSVIPEIEDDKTKPSSGSNEKEWEHVVETVPDEGVKA
mmetsp:Transcript_35167/g.92089  ORF Transcript_35167/g.92089 Transcript_35167/m.92089 type:complete len:316 (+) Transcript_35167:36-983(+)